MGVKVTYCGPASQERMVKNGWRLVIRNGYNETPDALYERLAGSYEKVKICWAGTMVRGIHSYFALVK